MGWKRGDAEGLPGSSPVPAWQTVWERPGLLLGLAVARSWLPPSVDFSDGWGYPRLPLSLRCIFYKGAGTEQTGFQLVSVFCVVTLSIKFPALTMRRGGSGHPDWAGAPRAAARLGKGAWRENQVSCFPNINLDLREAEK